MKHPITIVLIALLAIDIGVTLAYRQQPTVSDIINQELLSGDFIENEDYHPCRTNLECKKLNPKSWCAFERNGDDVGYCEHDPVP